MIKSLSHNQVGVLIAGILVAILYVIAWVYYSPSIFILFGLASIFLIIKTFVIVTLIEKKYTYPLARAVGISNLFLILSIIIYIEVLIGHASGYNAKLLFTRIVFQTLFIIVSTAVEGGVLYSFFGDKISPKRIFIYLLLANIFYAIFIFWLPEI